MEKSRYGFLLFFSVVIIFLGLVSFISCVIAESKKSKRKDLKVDGKLCYLPESHAYGFGIAALICVTIAQIIGNMVICKNFCSRDTSNNCYKNKTPVMATILLVFSWISFGISAVFLFTATSMSRKQPYGEGWLDRECYLVKNGVFLSAGFLALVTVSSIFGAAIFSSTKKQQKVEQNRRVHAQI